MDDNALTDFGLSEKEIIFCEKYAIYANAAKAAREAGYNNGAQSARQLLTKKEVQECLKELKSKAAEVAGVTIIRNAMELARIAFDDEEAKASEKIKAIEVLNKMFAFNAPEKSDVTVTNKSELDGKTDEELAALIETKRLQRQALSE